MKKKAETATGNSQGIVRTLPLEEILSDRFARYSKYIIQERALPDANPLCHAGKRQYLGQAIS